MSIEWEKVLEKPNKSYKVVGNALLNYRQKVENLERDLSNLTEIRKELTEKVGSLEKRVESLVAEIEDKASKISSLETNVDDLKKSVYVKEEEITALKKESDERAAQSEKEIGNLTNQMEELLGTLQAKDAALLERDEMIEDLNTKIEELKEQIPKKRVAIKPDETVKGAGCPKCGWTTLEEYKYVNGEKKLIRKYCPNTFCFWSSAEEPTIQIAMSADIPEEVSKEIKIFKMKGNDIEATTTLDSSMVVIIADPAQEIVWIWKGSESSRFEYAEATRQATYIRNEVVKKTHAPLKRVDEGEEPENFPKIEPPTEE